MLRRHRHQFICKQYIFAVPAVCPPLLDVHNLTNLAVEAMQSGCWQRR